MIEYIYFFNGVYYREITDKNGRIIQKKPITEAEYLSFKR